jgi:hypothetical protein
MPSFFGYVFKYALPILIPIFILVWLLFFMIPSGDHDMIMQDCAQIYEIWKGAAAVAADSLSVVH